MANPDCAILIKQINDALFKRANKHLAASGLTLSQMRLQQLLIDRIRLLFIRTEERARL